MQVHSQEEIVAEFLRRSRIQKIYSFLAGGCVILFFIYRVLLRDTLEEDYGLEFRWVVCFFLLTLALVFILTWINWRCPLCHSYLGMKMNDLRCPRCGVPFEKAAVKAESAREKFLRSND